jgi:chloramphenicol 3-O phosphotransferase
VEVDVIVLNGGSSSGKSSLAVCLQKRLPGTWFTLGIDDLIRALSRGPTDTTAAGTLEFKPDGSIAVGQAFRQAEASWYEGLAAIARAGTGVIVDEVFLDGGESQARLQAALRGLAVVWVGVRCHPETAEARELRRPDRTKGMAKDQAERVHEGVSYDIVVDTTDTSSAECATLIVASWRADTDFPRPKHSRTRGDGR